MRWLDRLLDRLAGVPRSQRRRPDPPVTRCGSCRRWTGHGCLVPTGGGFYRWVETDAGTACVLPGGPGAIDG